MDKSRFYKLLTWIVIFAQVVAVAGTATVGVLQPTPQMAQEAAQQAGLGDWWSQRVARLTEMLQPWWGEPTAAEASAVRDVGPHADWQFPATVHPEENWVVNGSFELSPIIANGTGNRISGWNILTGNSDVWGWWISPDGSRKQLHLSGDQPGAISQVVTGLTAGQSYFFEFDYTSETGSQSARVQLIDSGGADVINQTVTSPGRPDGPGWRTYRNTFAAPADGQIEIRFTQTSPVPGTLSAFTIDDVRIAKRLINYVLNGSFEAGWPGLNQTNIPYWTVVSGKVDVWNGYYNPDQSIHELDLAGTPGPGVVTQVVSGLTAGQSYVLEFDYSVNAVGGEQAKAQLLDGVTPLIDQTVTINGDPNHKGWKHFRQSFTAPAGGSVTLRFQDLSNDVHIYHGIIIDNVRVADAPLNYVVNGDFEASPSALNIANDALPGWTVTSGPLDNFHPGLLYDKAIDLNGSPGSGKVEQTVTGLTAGQVYAFQFHYANHSSWVTYAYARLLDSTNAKLYEKRISCKGHVVHQGWCTLRYLFTAPADGQVKIVFENDEADGNPFYGTNIDNVMVTRDLNYMINGNYSSGPIGLNQTNVPGWAASGPTDTHDGFGGGYRFTVDLNGSPGDGKLRQVITGLAPGQSYTLRYNYASTAHNYLVRFDVKVIDASGANTLVSVNQSTDQLPYVGGWKEAKHTFTAPADGMVQVTFANNETDNNPYYAALIDNIQLWGQAATAGAEINVCNGTIRLPRTTAVAPGGVTGDLAAWYKADADAENGGSLAPNGASVDAWRDQSGYSNDALQDNATLQPEFVSNGGKFNFNPSLNFNPNARLQAQLDTNSWGNGDGSVYVVYNQEVDGAWRNLVDFGITSGDSNNPQLGMTPSDVIGSWDDLGGGQDDSTFTVVSNETHIAGYDWTYDAFGAKAFHFDGEYEIGGASDKIGPTLGAYANIGGDPQLGEYMNGQIAEIAVYQNRHSSTERQKVHSYLALKYGITMRVSANSGDYVNSAGEVIWNQLGNSNYHHDVAGIGRDDASGLEQKQSVSVNSDNLVTIGLGGIATDNAGNLSNFDADQSFLLWGNNDAATAVSTSVSVTLTRMARIWTVQETTPITAPLGVVTVRVSQGSLGLAAGQGGFLLRSDDPVFTNNDTILFLTCDGVNCEAEFDFTDGDYFTFGRASVSPEITVTPTSNSFGNVGISESSPVKDVVISNSGNAPLNLSSIQMTNTGGGQFTNNNSCGATLNPGSSCTVGVTFAPNTSGAQSGVLTITSNDSDEGSVAVNLNGAGVTQAPDITVSPMSLSFTDTIVTSSALAQSVVITNSGTGNLAIQSLTLGGADSDEFVVVGPGSSCTPLTKNLADNESCDVEIVFSPTSAGAKSATLLIGSNDTDEITTTVTLSGVGVTCAGLLNSADLTADDPEAIAEDNSAAVCVLTTAPPDLMTTIGQPSPNFVAGVASNVPMTVSNVGAGPTTGTVTASMTLPANTSAPANFTSGPWSCTTSGQTVTCTQPGPIAAGASSTIQVPVTPNASTVGTQPGPFTGSASTPGETNTGNNNATPMTPSVAVTGVPDLVTTIGQPSPNFVAGVASNVPMTVSNVGAGPTSGPITATVTLPANTSAPASFTSGPWSCTTVGQTVTCTQLGPIAAGASSTIQLPVTPNASTVGTQPGPFTGSVTTPGESNAGNNNAAPMTPTTPVAPTPTSTVTAPVKVILGGAYDSASGLMRDQLRTLVSFPLTSPYGGSETTTAGVLTVTGNDAIVDWVLVEVRSSATPATVLASQAALLQRDGDVVKVDGSSTLTFTLSGGNYHVAVKQRNHLGAMTGSPLALSASTPTIDFTNMAATYGANGQRLSGGKYMLWAGNANGDASIIMAGPNNDKNGILTTVLTAPGNTSQNANYVVSGYAAGDLNLDGKTLAAGPNNDINLVGVTVFLHPGNTAYAANYIVAQQLP